MEMEDHHHHHHLHHNQIRHHHPQHHHLFGMNSDLRQVVNGPRPAQNNFPAMPSHTAAAELYPGHRNLTPQHYDVMMFGRDIIMAPGLHEFASTTTHDSVAVPTTITIPTPPVTTGFDAEGAACIGGDASTGRWPRQETLTLLDIRSRLDPKFKEANHKGPLWDEVSRIMSEEHGYQRSGKKCREKFENLYKYYKKTKEGKAGRHDGKHYRFFRQLEALYGENSNTVSVPETNVVSSIHFQATSHAPSSQTNQEKFHPHNKHCDSLSLTHSTNFDTSSSSDGDGDNDHTIMMESKSMEKRRKRKSGRSWKVKIKDFIDSQMRKLMEKQKEWLDKLVKTLEDKEKERIMREEEWRKQEASRLEREQKFWAKERAWIEARDASLMEALQKLTGREILKAETDEGIINAMAAEVQNQSENQNNNEDESEILNSNGVMRGSDSWQESEILRLQQLRTEMETRFPPHSEISEEVKWEVVATKMAYFGYERSALMYKEKWESVSNKEGKNKKRKEDSRSCVYFKNNDDQQQSSMYDQGSAYCGDVNDQRPNGSSSSPSKSSIGNVAPSDSCFPFLMSTEGGNLWENYGLKLNNSNQKH